MLVVNGQFPGPTIEANWGDVLNITVNNQLPNNGTSMHWHGMRQLNSNEMDGVNGITECPIAPGDSRTYIFQATEYGTSWYHSHFSAQYGEGVQGPILIHGPSSMDYDEDLGTVSVTDWYNRTACQEDYFAERTGPPNATNYLLNGINATPDGSSGQRAQWNFQAGKKYLLRLINTSIDNHFKIQIDNHVLNVVSTDFVQIQPYQTTSLNLGIGQRYDVIVEANQQVSSYFLRAINQESCGVNYNTGLGNSNGIIQYNGASSALPTSTAYAFTNACEDEPLASLVPMVTKTVDNGPFEAQASSLPVNVTKVDVAGESLYRWQLNDNIQDINWSNPTLAQVASGNTSYADDECVIELAQADVWTYWVIQNDFLVPHPMHLHGHDFSILGNGAGYFNDALIGTLNFHNPPRRDVTLLPASGYVVIAFLTDNPGAWLMHCHIAYHISEGLGLQFVEMPSKIPNVYGESQAEFAQTCNAWKAYEAANPEYQKEDSGLRRRDPFENGFFTRNPANILKRNER